MDQPPNSDDLIALGEIVNTHGLRGELRLRPFNPETVLLVPGRVVQLRRAGAEQAQTIATVRRHRSMFLLTFTGCDSIEQAETLVGSELCVGRQELPAVGENEIYHFELIGMRVVTLAGEDIGSVVEVMDATSADICVVRGARGENLIPMVADIVKEIDRSGRRIVIDPIPGLLEEAR
ncbi:MAG TPA: ribosome maturation factor RimM [Terriglobales bacterium]|nr:ribosome maturation factor RimM [Terriglobales bacterium]